MLSWFLPYINMFSFFFFAIHQYESAIRIHMFPSLLNLPLTSHPIPLLYVVTEHQAEFLVSYSRFPLAIYFTYDNVCYNAAFSFRPTLLLPLCSQVWSLCLCLYCCPTKSFISTMFLNSIYMG